MKRRSIALAFFSLLLFGCGNPQEAVEEIPETRMVLNLSFVFSTYINPDAEPYASLHFQGSNVSFSGGDVHFDGPRVAGDQLEVVFEGEHEMRCIDVYPGECRVSGKVKSSTHIKTQILGIHVDDATIGDIADELKADYHLDNTYVVLNKEGRCTDLETYDGHDLYLSVNKWETEYFCSCQEGAQCEPCLTYIAGLYAYNPRPNEEA